MQSFYKLSAPRVDFFEVFSLDFGSNEYHLQASDDVDVPHEI